MWNKYPQKFQKSHSIEKGGKTGKTLDPLRRVEMHRILSKAIYLRRSREQLISTPSIGLLTNQSVIGHLLHLV